MTIDTFVGEVQLDCDRSILVYQRQHGGRSYVRWRVFHRHRRFHNWYADKRRAFVLPVAVAWVRVLERVRRWMDVKVVLSNARLATR